LWDSIFSKININNKKMKKSELKQIIKEEIRKLLKKSVNEGEFEKDDRVRTTGGVDFGDEMFTVIHQIGDDVTVEDDEDEIQVFKASKLELAESVN